MVQEDKNISALETILEWSVSRPSWQRDALRRIISNGPIPEGEIDELVQLCKKDHGFETPSLDAKVLTKDHLSSNPDEGDHVRLLSLKDVVGVNQLAPDQKISFDEDGITVIFGRNGTGKSGYARLLKRACRARHAGEIIPDIYNPAPKGNAEATIEVKIGDNVQPPIRWIDDDHPHKTLSAISIYDKDCGSVHVKGKTEVAYRPFSLDVPYELSEVSEKMKKRLNDEKQTLEAARSQIFDSPTWSSETTVGSFLTNLSIESDINTFRSLGKLTAIQQEKREALEKDLKEDPEKVAIQNRKTADSISNILKSILRIDNDMSDETLGRLKKCADNARNKRENATIAANSTFNDLPLLGIGGDAWRDLWEAARKFAENDAYSEQKPFPPRSDELCVLCLTPIDSTAQSRMESFENFIRQDINSQANLAEEKFKSEHKIFLENVKNLGVVEQLLNESSLDNDDLLEASKKMIKIARLRQSACANAIESSGEMVLPSWPVSPIKDMEKLERYHREYADQIMETTDPEKRKALELELNDLRDRTSVPQLITSVEAEIERLKHLNILRKCLGDLGTNAITRLGTKIADEVVTPQIQEKFEEEIMRLVENRMHVEIVRSGGKYGSPQFEIRFQKQPDAKVHTVLSDGEQGCVAMAAFLTELATAPHSSTLIFDDPVSSLDHLWRSAVAERLVREASQRQVIIFSHDLVFVNKIVSEAKLERINFKLLSLVRQSDVTGVVQDGLSWDGSGVAKRIDLLKRAIQNAAKCLKNTGDMDKYSKDVRVIYSELRSTWERAIEDIALSGVIHRYDERVNKGKLVRVTVVTEEDCDILNREYQRCNELTIAHDSSRGGSGDTPTSARVLEDIEKLCTWKESITRRQENLVNSRKK